MVKDLCFEIIERCPNECKFCSSNSCISKDKIIKFDDFKRVIDYFMSEGGIEELSLSGGEPFLHPDLFKMVEYSKSLGIRTVIFTSGVKYRCRPDIKVVEYYKNKMENDLKEIEETDDESATITPDTIRKYETEFNKKCSWHGVLVQFIPIFPLLGILGTVAGLMLQIQSNDITGMMDSLDVALTTTLFGLIFAIALKVIEALFPSRVIYDVEVMLEDFEKKMSIAEMFETFKNK